MSKKKPLVAISGCLIGEEIRYDGQHKRSPHTNHEFRKIFDYHSFCPEVAMGLGIPRATIKLMDKKGKVHIVDSKDPTIDHTKLALKTFKTHDKGIEEASGIILTKGSPSCGYDPIRVYNEKTGIPTTKSMGLWAIHLEEKFPLIPKIDSGRLYDDHLRDTFRTQVIVFDEYKYLKKEPRHLVKFHETYKYYIFQYGAVHLKKLGSICAGVTKSNFNERYSAYAEYLFATIFKKSITSKNRTNVAEHLAGYFKNKLSSGDKKYLHENIKAYYDGKLSFESLIVLIGFLTKTCDDTYLKDQKLFSLYSKH